jgi:ADP-ribosylglycohydrolase
LSIINLGHDTDTSAAITGGLAGLYYGVDNIPQEWLDQTARLEDIIELGNMLHTKWMLS